MLIDDAVELLKDGEWHSIRGLVKELEQPESRIRDVLGFCAEFNLVTFDASRSEVRIEEGFRRLLHNSDAQALFTQ